MEEAKETFGEFLKDFTFGKLEIPVIANLTALPYKPIQIRKNLREQITEELYAFMDEGKLNPYVSARYALEDAPKALRDLLDRKVTGKVVVEAHR